MPLDPVSAVSQAVGQVAQATQSLEKSEYGKDLVATCGRRNPLWGKEKKDAYNKCAEKFRASKETFLGMPKTVGIIVTSIVLLIVIIIVFKIFILKK